MQKETLPCLQEFYSYLQTQGGCTVAQVVMCSHNGALGSNWSD